MDGNYELKLKTCEKTGKEVVSAVDKECGGKEVCLCSHLCKSPCSSIDVLKA